MLTEIKYYRQEQAKYPDSIMLMKCYGTYFILDDNADKVFPILSEVLTHKDAGQCFHYSTDAYAYHLFSFGEHNLGKVIHTLVHNGHKVLQIDFIKAFEESGGYEEMDRIYKEMRQREEEKERLAREEEERIAREEEERKKREPVQLTLFDDFFN